MTTTTVAVTTTTVEMVTTIAVDGKELGPSLYKRAMNDFNEHQMDEGLDEVARRLLSEQRRQATSSWIA